jgi:translocation and assembly module TamA
VWTSLDALAAVDIKIEGVRDELANNIRPFLSLTRYADRDDVTAEVMARLERRIPAEVKKALEPLGYFQSTAQTKISQDGKKWTVVITVEAGRAIRISEVNIAIRGEGETDGVFVAARKRGSPRPGQRLDQGAYERFKNDLLRTALSNGYLDASLTKHQLVIDPTERRATIDLELNTGRRYRIGHITIEQHVVSDEIVRRLLRIKEGDPYTTSAILQSQYALDDSEYFRGAAIETGQRDSELLEVPVTVRAKANRRHHYAASAGYGTDTQARGSLTWNDRLVNSYGHRSRVELTASGVGYEIGARYIIPVMDMAVEKIEFGLSSTKEELADATSYRKEFTVGLTQVLGSWQRVLFVNFLNETSEIPNEPSTTDFLIIPGISFATLPSYALGQEPRRYSIFSELTGSPHTLGSDASYVRLRVEGERVFDLGKLWHLRLRGQLGASWVADFSELPLSQRFFAGGDNSVRGFSLNELSPTDAEGNKVGGRDLVVGTIEFERDLPRNFRAAVFYDIGNAFNSFSDPLEYSVGVGLRWHVSVASVGVDVAQALSEPGRSPRLHLHISTLF